VCLIYCDVTIRRLDNRLRRGTKTAKANKHGVRIINAESGHPICTDVPLVGSIIHVGGLRFVPFDPPDDRVINQSGWVGQSVQGKWKKSVILSKVNAGFAVFESRQRSR